jgi:hypothetical protein
MTPIEIRYRPISFLPWIRKIITGHPDGWSELTPAQLITVACVYKGTITDDVLISSMLSIPGRIVRRMMPLQKIRIVELLEFIKNIIPFQEFIIKEIGPYSAPKPRLKDESFGTFIFAESYFSDYREKSNPVDLNRFIACWYRKGKFNEKEIDIVARVIAGEEFIKKEAIFINYQLIREFLAKAYPYVFKAEGEITKNDAANSWVDVFDAFVGDDLKDQDKYADLPVSSVLRYLNQRIKKNLEYESKVH